MRNESNGLKISSKFLAQANQKTAAPFEITSVLGYQRSIFEADIVCPTKNPIMPCRALSFSRLLSSA